MIRKTSQYELPVVKDSVPVSYDIYPTHSFDNGQINIGFDSLAQELGESGIVKLDGFVGILFEEVRRRLDLALQQRGISAKWIGVNNAMLSSKIIDELVEPFLGGDDPVFGKLCQYSLSDFFDQSRLVRLAEQKAEGLTIFYGTGAALVEGEGTLIFFDIAKNEIQFRSRAGVLSNLGANTADEPKKMYKRFYFVDWIVLRQHMKSIKEKIDFFVDGQRSNEITWVHGEVWRKALLGLLTRPLRVRPWFEPGVWGGSWIKENIGGLNNNVINYAWSFELITPENGIILAHNKVLLECSFDWLMFFAKENLVGTAYKLYGDIFPIRFDFLDTFNGGNLSIQCHPRKEYMLEHFGEIITQEETYYILDRQPNAKVYLGFQEGVTK